MRQLQMPEPSSHLQKSTVGSAIDVQNRDRSANCGGGLDARKSSVAVQCGAQIPALPPALAAPVISRARAGKGEEGKRRGDKVKM